MPALRFLRLSLCLLLAAASSPSLFAVAPATGTPYPLTFANPIINDGSNNRDVGDIKQNVPSDRLIRAYGGTPPYTFSVDEPTKSLMIGTGLELLPNGILTFNGQMDPIGVVTFPFTVKDSFGFTPRSVTETFRINFVTFTNFRFASTGVPTGTVGSPYSARLPVINGTAPIIFGATNIALGGVPLTSLENAGLSLAADGTLHGVPIAVGTLTFTASATDAGSNAAADFAGAGNSQIFNLQILPNTVVSSSFTPTQITIKTGIPGKGSVALKAVVNLNGSSFSSLYGLPCTVRVGRYTSPIFYFDEKGRSVSPKGTSPLITASVKKNGVFAISIARADIPSLGFTGLSGDRSVEVRLGGAVIGSSLQNFKIKVGKAGSATITSKSTKPVTSYNRGGTGQLTSVAGADDKAGTGDSWKVNFVGILPANVDTTLATAVSAKVKLGTGYEDTVALTRKGASLTGKADKKKAVVASFAFDTGTGKGVFTTGVLPHAPAPPAPVPPGSTGIPLAGSTTARGFLPVEIIFLNAAGNPIYNIQSALAITATGKGKWTSTIK